MPFDIFWTVAVRRHQPNVLTSTPDPPADCIRWPSDSTPRLDWQAAIYATREGWWRAYEREQATSHEQALAILQPILEQIEELRRVEGEADGFDARLAVA